MPLNLRYHIRIRKILLHNTQGHTILELVLAISITLILASLILAAYLIIVKEFQIHSSRANTVMEALVVKKKMDSYCQKIRKVTATYKMSLEYQDYYSNQIHSISFNKNTLQQNNKVIIKKLKNFSYTLSPRKSAAGKALLLWEIDLESGFWLGGACEVYTDL